MKRLLLIIMVVFGVIGCDALTTAGGSSSEKINEVSLTKNEKVIFSLLADEIYYVEYVDPSKQFRSIGIGVDYYHYGLRSEEGGEITVGANDPEMDWDDDQARFLITKNWDEGEKESLVHGELSIILDSGTIGSGTYSYVRKNSERGIRSSGYLVDAIDEISYGEKVYVGYSIENVESDSMRSFDLELATTPNDEYEHTYLFYVIINQEEEMYSQE